MKGWPFYGELEAVKHLPERHHAPVRPPRLCEQGRTRTPGRAHGARRPWTTPARSCWPAQHDLVILDEVNVALDFGLIKLADVLGLLDQRPPHVELVLTGRNAPPALIARADLVTEMLADQAPVHRGRRGPEGHRVLGDRVAGRLVSRSRALTRMTRPISGGLHVRFPEPAAGGLAERHAAASLDRARRSARRSSSPPPASPINRLYTPLDVADLDYGRDLGFPGEYPFTRGVHPTMYRGRLWTMRMFAGFGTAEETNAALQVPAGPRRDRPLRRLRHAHALRLRHRRTRRPQGEVGKCGVAVSSLADMEILFDGIPLDEITTSMTINGPAAVIWAMYIAAAEKRGVPRAQAGRHDPERHPQGVHRPEGVDLPARAVAAPDRGHHRVRRAASCRCGTPSPSAATTSARRAPRPCRSWPSPWPTAWPTSQAAIDRGLDVDDFAPRLSFFFNAHNDFFEEIAKFRAARRIWARVMRERFGAKNPRSWLLRFHTQTAGCSLTAQQPENNIVRMAIQALAAVLGGTQSLHTNSMDEALALPTRGGGPRGPAHPADHRPRERRGQHRRPAGRLLLRRGADRRDGARRPASTSTASTSWAA